MMSQKFDNYKFSLSDFSASVSLIVSPVTLD